MPAAYIHENIAQKALGKIKHPPQYIKENMAAFELGAQGPDFLFFYNIFKFWDKDFSPNKLGEKMHVQRVNEFFRSVLINSKKQGAAALAWTIGFVTHYAADTTIHPFVYGKTDNADGSHNTNCHLTLESQFDTWYYRSKGNKGIPKQAKFSKIISNEQKSQVALTVSIACDEVYPESRLTYEQAHKAIDDMGKIISVLYSPYKIKHSIFTLIEYIIKKPGVVTSHAPAQKLPEYDFLNLEKEIWENPWDKSIKSNHSFPELFDIAADKAAKYIETVMGFFDGNMSLDETSAILGNNSYSSGLPIKEK